MNSIRKLKPTDSLLSLMRDDSGRGRNSSPGLRDAIAYESADDVEFALLETWRNGLRPEHVPVLIELLAVSWHSRHEDIARALQELRDPRAVPALFNAVLKGADYIDEVSCKPFVRKCIWALADIGTPEARKCLEQLASEKDVDIAAYAERRLQRWQEELERKGAD